MESARWGVRSFSGFTIRLQDERAPGGAGLAVALAAVAVLWWLVWAKQSGADSPVAPEVMSPHDD
jgi:hypothetical protein